MNVENEGMAYREGDGDCIVRLMEEKARVAAEEQAKAEEEQVMMTPFSSVSSLRHVIGGKRD